MIGLPCSSTTLPEMALLWFTDCVLVVFAVVPVAYNGDERHNIEPSKPHEAYFIQDELPIKNT